MTKRTATILIVLAAVLSGLLHWQLKPTTENPVFFVREDAFWTLYKMENDKQVPTGLSVPHQANPNAQGMDEEMFAAVSPNGKKIAFMQKPAWPHTLYVADVDGVNLRPLFTPDLPTHTFIENGFTWAGDNLHLYYATTWTSAGPADSEAISTLYRINTETGEQEEIANSQRQPAKIMPVGRMQ
ncbi:MAG: hypothetical protein V1760_01085 [Candidatus Peregrinibacteria bacterium]